MWRITGVWRQAPAATLVGVLLASSHAFAANAPSTGAPTVQAVLDCRKVQEPTERLACYDKAVSAMEQAQTTGDLVTVDREQRRAARHQAFGLMLPTLSFLDRGENDANIKVE